VKYEQALIKAIELKFGIQDARDIQLLALDLMKDFVTLKYEKASQDYLNNNKDTDPASRQRKCRFFRPLNASLKTQLAIIKISRDKIGLDDTIGVLK
jgi:hypothetical protein